ncbi:mCG145438, partial [Mus musculus]
NRTRQRQHPQSAVPQTSASTCQDLVLWQQLLKAVEGTLPTQNSAATTDLSSLLQGMSGLLFTWVSGFENSIVFSEPGSPQLLLTQDYYNLA